MAEKLNLLATFITRDKIEETITKIKEYFTQNELKIFLLKNVDDENKVILTYSVVLDDTKILQYNKSIPGTINLHRKKETNTIFSLNALNQIVLLENNGQQDRNFVIDWENYRNCILITQKGNNFLKIRTELEKVIK